MAHKDREIELKLRVKGARGLAVVERALRPLVARATRVIRGKSEDAYFKPPAGARADFVRLRRANRDGDARMTIKHTDKGNNFDRVEKETSVDFRNMYGILEDLLGTPAGYVNKRYVVLFFGKTGTDADTTVSIYRIVGDKRVFLEIEAATAKKVHFWMARVSKLLHEYELERENESLYSLFVAKATSPEKPARRRHAT